MSRPCGVCTHESRPAIDMAILNRKPLIQIARDFGFTYTSSKTGEQVGDHKAIAHHRDKCMAEAYQEAMKEQSTVAGAAIAARLAYLDREVDEVIQEARKGTPVMVGDVPLLDDDGKPVTYRTVGQLRAILSAVGQARANAELMSRLAGAIPEAQDEDLDKIRKAMESPEARKLLAQLDEAMAAQDDSATETAT